MIKLFQKVLWMQYVEFEGNFFTDEKDGPFGTWPEKENESTTLTSETFSLFLSLCRRFILPLKKFRF